MKPFFILLISLTFISCSKLEKYQENKNDAQVEESNYGLKISLEKYLKLYEDVLRIESEGGDVKQKMKQHFTTVLEFAGPQGVKVYKALIKKKLSGHDKVWEDFKAKLDQIELKYLKSSKDHSSK